MNLILKKEKFHPEIPRTELYFFSFFVFLGFFYLQPFLVVHQSKFFLFFSFFHLKVKLWKYWRQMSQIVVIYFLFKTFFLILIRFLSTAVQGRGYDVQRLSYLSGSSLQTAFSTHVCLCVLVIVTSGMVHVQTWQSWCSAPAYETLLKRVCRALDGVLSVPEEGSFPGQDFVGSDKDCWCGECLCASPAESWRPHALDGTWVGHALSGCDCKTGTWAVRHFTEGLEEQ